MVVPDTFFGDIKASMDLPPKGRDHERAPGWDHVQGNLAEALGTSWWRPGEPNRATCNTAFESVV